MALNLVCSDLIWCTFLGGVQTSLSVNPSPTPWWSDFFMKVVNQLLEFRESQSKGTTHFLLGMIFHLWSVWLTGSVWNTWKLIPASIPKEKQGYDARPRLQQQEGIHTNADYAQWVSLSSGQSLVAHSKRHNNANLLLVGWHFWNSLFQALDGTSLPNSVTLDFQLMHRNYHRWQVYRKLERRRSVANCSEQGQRSTLIRKVQYYTSKAFLPSWLLLCWIENSIGAEAAFATIKAKAYDSYLKGIRWHMYMLKGKCTWKSSLTSLHQVWACGAIPPWH